MNLSHKYLQVSALVEGAVGKGLLVCSQFLEHFELLVLVLHDLRL